MRLAIFKYSDGRVAINIDAITSVQEVKEVDDNDYVAIILKGTTFYFTNYTHGKIVNSLNKDTELYATTIQIDRENKKLFFTFKYKGKDLSFRLDDIMFIQETDIENEYYLTIRLRDGVEYYIENVEFDKAVDNLAWLVIIEPDKK